MNWPTQNNYHYINCGTLISNWPYILFHIYFVTTQLAYTKPMIVPRFFSFLRPILWFRLKRISQSSCKLPMPVGDEWTISYPTEAGYVCVCVLASLVKWTWAISGVFVICTLCRGKEVVIVIQKKMENIIAQRFIIHISRARARVWLVRMLSVCAYKIKKILRFQTQENIVYSKKFGWLFFAFLLEGKEKLNGLVKYTHYMGRTFKMQNLHRLVRYIYIVDIYI